MQNETELYQRMLCGYVERMARWLRKIPTEQWDWTPAVYAPTCRQVAEHTWVTLVCDRQHVEEPDVFLHPLVPDPPQEPAELCTALEAEAKWWREWLGRQTPETYLAPRKQFGVGPVNVRWMVYHITQQVVYKLGQLSTLYYALGLDGTEPYQAPFPNEYYLRHRQLIEIPLIAAILREDNEEAERLLQAGVDPNAAAADGSLPLLFAITVRHPGLIQTLLRHGADPFLPDGHGHSAHQAASWINEPALLALFSEKQETSPPTAQQ
jgi:hypothetical protein